MNEEQVDAYCRYCGETTAYSSVTELHTPGMEEPIYINTTYNCNECGCNIPRHHLHIDTNARSSGGIFFRYKERNKENEIENL